MEAARFASDSERLPVRVLRCPPSYFSMRPSRPCRAWQRSARELVGRQVAVRLRTRSTHTVVADDCHITLGRLDAKAETVLAQVRADRCFVADGRRYNSVEMEKVIAAARCPHGCGCRPTWSHYTFRCKQPELVKLRGGLRGVLGEVADVTGLDDASHGQMRMML